jgi:hypothetical protein
MISITLSDFWNYIIQYEVIVEAVIAIVITVFIAKYLTVTLEWLLILNSYIQKYRAGKDTI